MPLPPDLTQTNWPNLADTTLYPSGWDHAPHTTPVASITKACFPGGAPLRSVLPFAHPTEPLAQVSPNRVSTKFQLPPPPSISVHCPTIRAEATFSTAFAAAAVFRNVTVDAGDACLPIITDVFTFPCTSISATASITMTPDGTPPTAVVHVTPSTTGGTCSSALGFEFSIPSAGCPSITLTPNEPTLGTVTPSNGGPPGSQLTITNNGNSGAGCSPSFSFDINTTPCAPQFVPGRVTVKEVNDPAVDGPVGGTMTVIVIGDACERTIQHDMDVRIPARSSGGSKIGVGSLVGGNAYPISGKLDGTESADDADYPTTRPLGLPLPMTDTDGAPILMPTVANWDKVTLADDYKFGDDLPRLPWGLCYVKLERPYSFGAASWLAAYEKAPAATTTSQKGNVPTVTAVRAGAASSSTLTITWSRQVILAVDASQVKGKISLSGAGSPVRVQSVAVSGTAMTVQLSRSISRKDDPSITIAIAASMVKSADGADKPPLMNAGQSTGVTFVGPPASITIAINRAAQQAFRYGDYVLMDLTGIKITDGKGVTLSVPEILAPASGSVPTHTHSTYSGGLEGGGPLLG